MSNVRKKPSMLQLEEAVKRGKCSCCGDTEWLFRDGDKLTCGGCKLDKQLMEQTCGKGREEW